ncbi:Det1 complexing ubiquitin ligase [Nesidiocoris tenuis]|uniref:DET1- and DDB1-associated protein 1 n=1 Tax=Nesidiocoris tenuis TaxID=355587 RepID=A0ABN7B1Z4_9HEMI|nr:Det1 complexing ubiquitin ligase [Nesidiocoris tenuis]
MSIVSDFVTGLPSYDPDNFIRYSGTSRNVKRPSTYVQTKDSPADAIIVNEKTNVLLRYLNCKWEKEEKERGKKRGNDSSANLTPSPKKKKKLENDDDSS